MSASDAAAPTDEPPLEETIGVPCYGTFVDAFPMTVSGEDRTFRMREIAADELGLARVAEAVAAA